MADTNGLIKIQDVVDRFMLMYKVSSDDFALYFEHTALFLNTLRVHHGGGYKEEKIAVDVNGFFDMPDELVDLIDIYLPKDGAKWYFTLNRGLVTTSTTTDDVEGFDSDYGEGTDIKNPYSYGYGAVGGVNDYYYCPIWNDRRVLISGVTSADVTVLYKTSGLNLDGETYIPMLAQAVVMAKLKKERAYIKGLAIGERELAAQDLKEEIALYRKTGMISQNEVKDIFRSATTQAPMRYD